MDNIVEAFITIAFIAIAFISWIIRLIGESNEKAKAQARQPGGERSTAREQRSPNPRPKQRETPSRQSAQSEIDSFLRQATRSPAKSADEEIEIEVIPDEELRERNVDSNKSGNRPSRPNPAGESEQRTEWDRQYESRRERLRSTIAERHLETTPLGAELRAHIERTMAEAAAIASQRDEAERELTDARARIQTIQEKSGDDAESLAELSGARTSDVIALLKNPHTVKNAIVINEILSRPPGLRRR